MRIAIITPGFSAHSDDWAIPALLNFARTLAQQHEVHIFSQRYPTKGTYQFDNLTHQALGGGQSFGLASIQTWLQTSRAILAYHKKRPFDVLHAFWADEAGFAAVIAGTKIKRPVVVSLGGGELTRLPTIKYGAQRFLARRLTTRYALRQATIVTAGSNYQLDLCHAHQIAEHKLRLSPLGIDTHRFQPENRQRKQSKPHTPIAQSPSIIQAASLVPVKNQTLLLEVMNLAKKQIPNINLNLIGSGPCQDELTKLAHRLNLNQNIVWHGQCSYTEMSRLYQQSNLYLQTSYHESQGMAVLEAMACGIPVLGTPVGVVKDVACRPARNSAKALAAQVIDVLSDGVNYRQLRQQAQQVVEEEFSLSITTDNFLKIYEEAMSGKVHHP